MTNTQMDALTAEAALISSGELLVARLELQRNCDATVSATHTVKFIKTARDSIDAAIGRIGLWDHNIVLGQECDFWHPSLRSNGVGAGLAQYIMGLPRIQLTILTSQASVVNDLSNIIKDANPGRLTIMYRMGIPLGRNDVLMAVDPQSSPILERLTALRKCREMGVTVAALVDGILPGIGDSPADLKMTFSLLREVGVTELRIAPLRLNDPRARDFSERLRTAGLIKEAHSANYAYILFGWERFYKPLISNAQKAATETGFSNRLSIVFPRRYVKEGDGQ